MRIAGTVTLTGLSASEPAGQRILGPLSTTGTIVIGDTVALPLAAGDNNITVPPGATGVVIVQPTTGSAILKYRTSANASDMGLPIAPNYPFMHIFASPIPATIILNSSAAQASPTSFWMW